ncbi:sn-glycerol 3-phosphate transport system permease protein [Rhizobium paknamense]|uniref:sn-glycerol-3-phosphate transport system permease protein UgpA n=2 Tax=Rhizobium paknamense TaxID=1206817 RepID=A0ABU0I7X1_9HYPH|nr:sugar ABC transporter permease [Rhizobium paknamense]MDQ0454322.1 sn-glycerol 3-phosphate transport system permease protein [Rhizobium paknamense]
MRLTFYSGGWLYAALVAPILLLILIFFYLPVGLAFYWSFFLEQPFGGGAQFVGFDNFARLLGDAGFWAAARRSLVFMLVSSGLGLAAALALALAADRGLKMSRLARNVLIWPKAISVVSIGVIFTFIFNPFLGIFAPVNALFPGLWNPRIDGTQAFATVVLAQVWHSLPFNFIILLSGLQTIPDTLVRAAAMDGAGPWRRMRDLQLPLLTPQLFLTFVLEFIGAAVEPFGLIDTMTHGGPGDATSLLIYKIYTDGFQAYDLSGASAQTVLLMLMVIAMVLLQFRLERHVKYER